MAKLFHWRNRIFHSAGLGFPWGIDGPHPRRGNGPIIISRLTYGFRRERDIECYDVYDLSKLYTKEGKSLDGGPDYACPSTRAKSSSSSQSKSSSVSSGPSVKKTPRHLGFRPNRRLHRMSSKGKWRNRQRGSLYLRRKAAAVEMGRRKKGVFRACSIRSAGSVSSLSSSSVFSWQSWVDDFPIVVYFIDNHHPYCMTW